MERDNKPFAGRIRAKPYRWLESKIKDSDNEFKAKTKTKTSKITKTNQPKKNKTRNSGTFQRKKNLLKPSLWEYESKETIADYEISKKEKY